MKLRYSPTSPFVRKVVVAAHEAGVAARIAREPTDVWANDAILVDNPLGKVPALVTDDGVFVGSFACCDYLQALPGARRLIPDHGAARWRVMQMHGLADGAMEAAVAYVIETLRRPEPFIYPGALDRQIGKIVRTIAALEIRADDLEPHATAPDLGAITTACTLAYLDFRLAGKIDWRAQAPRLAAFYAPFAQRSSMRDTAPA